MNMFELFSIGCDEPRECMNHKVNRKGKKKIQCTKRKLFGANKPHLSYCCSVLLEGMRLFFIGNTHTHTPSVAMAS